VVYIEIGYDSQILPAERKTIRNLIHFYSCFTFSGTVGHGNTWVWARCVMHYAVVPK